MGRRELTVATEIGQRVPVETAYRRGTASGPRPVVPGCLHKGHCGTETVRDIARARGPIVAKHTYSLLLRRPSCGIHSDTRDTDVIRHAGRTEDRAPRIGRAEKD